MNRMQAAALLGVEVDSSATEAKKAYTSRARLLHPDRFADASASDLAAATSAMAQLNEAYEVFQAGHAANSGSSSDETFIVSCPSCDKRNRVPLSARGANCANCGEPLFRSGEEEQPEEHDSELPSWPDPSTACDLCGWGPAAPVTYRSVTGIIIWWRWSTFEAVVCSECNRAMFHESQARTLARGWWGIIAPFAAIIALVMNWVARSGSRRLGAPEGKCWEKYSLLPLPLYGAKVWWKRPGALIGLGIALAIAIYLGVAFANSQPPSRNESGVVTSGGNASIDDIRTGDCLNISTGATTVSSPEVVPCSQLHTTQVFASLNLSLANYSDAAAGDAANAQCEPYFERFVGIPYAQSKFVGSVLFPSSEGWASGQRGVSCLIELEGGASWTGSAQGSQK